MATEAAARRSRSFLRTATVLQTLTIFLQAVSAGLLLSTSYGGTVHSVGARVVYAAVMLHVLAAVLAWRPGGGPARPIGSAFGFLVLASAQVVLGIAHVPAVHVPLGVLMFGLSVLALANRMPRPAPARRRVSPGAPPSHNADTAPSPSASPDRCGR